MSDILAAWYIWWLYYSIFGCYYYCDLQYSIDVTILFYYHYRYCRWHWLFIILPAVWLCYILHLTRYLIMWWRWQWYLYWYYYLWYSSSNVVLIVNVGNLTFWYRVIQWSIWYWLISSKHYSVLISIIISNDYSILLLCLIPMYCQWRILLLLFYWLFSLFSEEAWPSREAGILFNAWNDLIYSIRVNTMVLSMKCLEGSIVLVVTIYRPVCYSQSLLVNDSDYSILTFEIILYYSPVVSLHYWYYSFYLLC